MSGGLCCVNFSMSDSVFGCMMQLDENTLACTYATLILHDDGLPITEANVAKLIEVRISCRVFTHFYFSLHLFCAPLHKGPAPRSRHKGDKTFATVQQEFGGGFFRVGSGSFVGGMQMRVGGCSARVRLRASGVRRSSRLIHSSSRSKKIFGKCTPLLN